MMKAPKIGLLVAGSLPRSGRRHLAFAVPRLRSDATVTPDLMSGEVAVKDVLKAVLVGDSHVFQAVLPGVPIPR